MPQTMHCVLLPMPALALYLPAKQSTQRPERSYLPAAHDEIL